MDEPLCAKDCFLMALTSAIEMIVISSACKREQGIIVEVKEKGQIPENVQLHQIKIISFAAACCSIRDMLEMDKSEYISKSVAEQQVAVGQFDCLRIELTDPGRGIIVCETLRFSDSEKRPIVSVKRREPGQGNPPRYVAQFKCGFGGDDVCEICIRLHQYLYKLRAGPVPIQLTLSVQSNQLPTKYLTTFCEEQNPSGDASQTPLLAESSHYFLDCRGDLFFYSSGPCELGTPAGKDDTFRNLSLRCTSAVANSGKQEITIHLYFYFGDNPTIPWSASANSTNLDAASLIPLDEMDATLKDVAYVSEPNGLATPDIALTVTKRNTASPDLVTLFLTVSETNIDAQTGPREKYSILNSLRSDLNSILSTNLVVTRRAITETLKKALHHHGAETAKAKDCKNTEKAIALCTKSIRDIVASSSSTLFRDTCFRMFDVATSAALQQAVASELENIITHGQTASENREPGQGPVGAAAAESPDYEDCEQLLLHL